MFHLRQTKNERLTDSTFRSLTLGLALSVGSALPSCNEQPNTTTPVTSIGAIQEAPIIGAPIEVTGKLTYIKDESRIHWHSRKKPTLSLCIWYNLQDNEGRTINVIDQRWFTLYETDASQPISTPYRLNESTYTIKGELASYTDGSGVYVMVR